MISRLAGRLVTGPVAFFLAGLLDVGLLLVAYTRWRIAPAAGSSKPGSTD